MKYLICLALLFSFPLSAQEKGPFDNWLFKFLEGESETFGDILGPNGEEFDQGAGTMTTVIDRKNKVARSVTSIRFKNQEDRPKSVSTVNPKDKNTYTGVTRDSNGGKSDYVLTIIDDKTYKSEVKAPNGISISINGTLKDENTIVTNELIKDADGKLLAQYKVTYKRATKPKKKE